MRLTSANSVNIGRLLPQMVYYFHAVAQLGAQCPGLPAVRAAEGLPAAQKSSCPRPAATSGTSRPGLMAKRAGLPITRFVAATNINDVVPEYLLTGRFEPRPSVADDRQRDGCREPEQLRAHALAVRPQPWTPCARTSPAAGTATMRCATTIRRVYETRGYLLDPHSAIAYLGLKQELAPSTPPRPARRARLRSGGVFLATAHPAKFGEIVEPIIGRPIVTPAPLAEALARPRHIMRIDASLDAVTEALGA